MAKGDKHVSYDLSVAPPIAKAPFRALFLVRSCWEERGSYSSALFLPRTSLRKKPQREIWTCEPLWKLMIHVWGSLEKGVRLKGTKLAERPSKPSICFWQTCKLSVNSSLSFSNCCTFSSSSGIWWSLWSWPIALKTTSPGGVPFLFLYQAPLLLSIQFKFHRTCHKLPAGIYMRSTGSLSPTKSCQVSISQMEFENIFDILQFESKGFLHSHLTSLIFGAEYP